MNILLVCPMLDKQSGLYLHDSLIGMGHRVAYFDWKQIMKDEGQQKMNNMLIGAIEKLKPELTIVIKGLGIIGAAIKKAKEVHPHTIVGWIFDVTLGGTYVSQVPQYIDLIKELDIFYTMDNDAIPELKKLGVNAKWLTEGCHPKFHKEQIFNSFQKRKYGSDIVFLGSVGAIHPNREAILKRIHDEGFRFKLYGRVEYPKDREPDWVKDHHTGFEAINDMHSLVCGASKLVIGIDGWPERSKSYSARLYRTLAAGGFLLTTHTKDIEKELKVGEHFDTFKNEEELINKIVQYLTNDALREKIAKAGQKEVLKNHTFTHRLQTIIDDVGKIEKFK